MALQFQIAERNTANGSPAWVRWSMVVIFLWFGTQKFTPYAAHEIAPLMTHSPFFGVLVSLGETGAAKVIGTIELMTAALLITGAFNPIASALGAALASGTFFVTFSFARPKPTPPE